MGGIWWFWPHIHNLLKIWTQKTYRPTYVVSLWVNLILGLKYWDIHSKGDRPDMKIPSSDPPSVHQIGSDDVLMTSVRGCYMMSILIALINLIVAEAIGQPPLAQPEHLMYKNHIFTLFLHHVLQIFISYLIFYVYIAI
jgi:hypothetical protein